MDQRHELPSLESVKFGDDLSLLGLVIAFLMLTSVCILGFILYFTITDPTGGSHLGLNVDTLLPAGLAIFSLILLAILRSPTFHYEWETSSNGLRFKGFACGGLIRWNEVVDIETRWVNIITGRRAVIRTRNEVTFLPVQDPALSASVWQHMRQAGKSEGIELDREAQSLWSESPDNVPGKIEWKHPSPVRLGRVIAGAVIFYALGFCAEQKLGISPFAGWIVALPLMWMAESSVRAILNVNCLSADEQGIAVRTLFRSITAQWKDIQSAKLNEGFHPRIEIQLSWWNRFYVPYLENDDQSRQVILYLTHHLRTHSQIPLPLPTDMLPEED